MKHKYIALHIPTGTRHEDRELDSFYGELSRLQFLELLNAWNGQMPGIWQYWSN